jgi:hypothetical protein
MSLSVAGPDIMSLSIRSGFSGVSAHDAYLRDAVGVVSESRGRTSSSDFVDDNASLGTIAEA